VTAFSRRAAVAWVFAAGAIGALGACGVGAPARPSAEPAAPAAGTPAPPSRQPPAPTAASEPSPDVAPSPDQRSDSAGEAPVAWLVLGAERHAGEIGGYVFGRSSSSAPWLPATALDAVTVPAGATAAVELDARATVAAWRAQYSAAGDTTGDALTTLGEGTGPAVRLPLPPPGEWVVSVVVTYGDGLGDGAYYWRLVVE
jgi:hypothetical protein